MSSIIDSLAKNLLHKAAVIYKASIAPHTYHIRLQAADLTRHNFIAGEHVRLFVGLDKGTALNNKLRTYSIWAHDAAAGTADITVCMHSAGVGAKWANEVQAGDTVYYMGPIAKLIIDTAASSYLMIGDDSALSHFYAMRSAIPIGKKVTGIMYATDKQNLFKDLDGSSPFTLLQLPLNPIAQLTSHITKIKDQISENTMVYLAGDARVCKELSRFLKQETPINSSNIKSKGFWMPGKTGMD